MQLSGTTLGILEREGQQYNVLVSGEDLKIQRYFLSKHFQKVKQKEYLHLLIDASHGEKFVESFRQSDLTIGAFIPGQQRYCCRMFERNSFAWISRLRKILAVSGYKENDIQKITAYIHLLHHIDSLAGGEQKTIDEKMITRYASSLQVQTVLQSMLDALIISKEEQMYLLAKYSELSAGGPELEQVLMSAGYVSSFESNALSIQDMHPGNSVLIKLERVKDPTLVELLLNIISWDVEDAIDKGKKVAVTIIDQYGEWGKQLGAFLNAVPVSTYCMFLADDFFGEDNSENFIKRFPVVIYTRHKNMNSCAKIENMLGDIPVVKTSYSLDRDRRFQNNTLLDRLFNTNKVEHYTDSVPVYEPKYMKERIYSLPCGMGIIDYQGRNSYFHI